MPLSDEIRIFIQGQGPVPSFKNKKRIVTNPKTGRPFLATEYQTKKWMTGVISNIESQLRSLCQIKEGGITPECLRRFAMRSLPQDDTWRALQIGSVRTKLVPKGLEGAVIVIEKVEPN
jgi:hypothetical protein